MGKYNYLFVVTWLFHRLKLKYLTARQTPDQSHDLNLAKKVSNPALITISEFDKHRESLLIDDAEEGWASKLYCYLGTMQHDIKKDSDIVEWWQVSFSITKMLATLLK